MDMAKRSTTSGNSVDGKKRKVTVRIDEDLALVTKLYCELRGETLEDRVNLMFKAFCQQIERDQTVTKWFSNVQKTKSWRTGVEDTLPTRQAESPTDHTVDKPVDGGSNDGTPYDGSMPFPVEIDRSTNMAIGGSIPLR
jgi:hypothetical protein